MTTSGADGSSPTQDERRWTAPQVVALLVAGAVQLMVIAVTVSLGLVWGGPLYVLAVVVTALGGWAAIWLARRRPVLVLLVPLASALLTALLLLAATGWARSTACSPQERAAFAELAAPAGETIELRGELANGCIARFTSTLSPSEVRAHYQSEFARGGWNPLAVTEGSVVSASRDGVVVRVEAVEAEAGLVVVVVDQG